MKLLEEFATGPAVLTVALIEAIAVSWFYGKMLPSTSHDPSYTSPYSHQNTEGLLSSGKSRPVYKTSPAASLLQKHVITYSTLCATDCLHSWEDDFFLLSLYVYPVEIGLKWFPIAHPQWLLKIPTGSKNWTDNKELVHSECICRVYNILP